MSGPWTDRSPLDVLAELVRLKDGPRDDAYRAAKDDAWQAARDTLAAFRAIEGEKPCERCDETGHPLAADRHGHLPYETCPDCDGTGKVRADRLVLEGPTRADERRKVIAEVVEALRDKGFVIETGRKGAAP